MIKKKENKIGTAVLRAKEWIARWTVKNGGIVVCSSKQPLIYPEVTGYYIPTLLRYGDIERAIQFGNYLLDIQNEDGSWSEPGGSAKYTFDTGMILKGLVALIENGLDSDGKYRMAAIRGADWICSMQREDGSIATPSYAQWGLPYGKEVPEAIHIYCLEPLRKLGAMTQNGKYEECINKALRFYLAQPDLTDFTTLSHFNAYIIEGLIDIGETGRALRAMDLIALHQREDGSVPAYSFVDFVCSTGLFQYAICWYKLGNKERGDSALRFALSLQNRSGGFFGSYSVARDKANYFPKNEISWAVKYCLDAIYYRENNQPWPGVEFYLIDAFEIFHYLPIYYALLQNGIPAKFVAEPCRINTSGAWFDDQTAIKILRDNHVKYSEECNPNALFAVSTQRVELLKKYRNKKVSLCYGMSFRENDTLREYVEGYDLRLVTGPFYKKLTEDLHYNTRVLIIGHPKLESALSKIKNKEEIKSRLGINTSKPILLYMPTWDENTSIQKFGNAIARLREKWFVLTKAHHCTYRLPEKKDDLLKLEKISDMVLEGNADIPSAVRVADFALSDVKSGASTDIPFINNKIPLVLLSIDKNWQNWCVNEIADFAPVVDEVSQLETTIDKLCFHDIYADSRRRLMASLIVEKQLNVFIDYVRSNL